MNGIKFCKTCEVFKSIEAFNKCKTKKGGRQHNCRECEREYKSKIAVFSELSKIPAMGIMERIKDALDKERAKKKLDEASYIPIKNIYELKIMKPAYSSIKYGWFYTEEIEEITGITPRKTLLIRQYQL